MKFFVITLICSLFFLLTSKASAVSDTIKISKDSLYTLIAEEIQEIDAQLKRNDSNILEGKEDLNQYVFHSGYTIVPDKTLDDKYFYITKVDKKAYGLYQDQDESNTNNILKNLHVKNNRKLVVYVTSMFGHPELFDQKNPDNETLLNNCANKIANEVYGANGPMERTAFSTICIIKYYGIFLHNILDKDGNDVEPNVTRSDFRVKHQFRFFWQSGINETCETNIKNSLNNERPTSIINVVQNVANVYSTVECKPGQPEVNLNTQGSQVTVNCLIDASYLKNLITNGTAEDLKKYCESIKVPVVNPTVIQSPNSTTTGPTEVEKATALAKYQKSLKECISVSYRINAIKKLLSRELVTNKYENIILDFIEHVKDDDIELFLTELKKDNLLNQLIEAVDDEIITVGGANYSKFIKLLTDLIHKSPSYFERLAELTEPENLEKRIIKWGYSGHNYELGAIRRTGVSLKDNGAVTVSREVLTDIKYSTHYLMGSDYTGNVTATDYVYSPLPDYTLDPYAPIAFINLTDLNALTINQGIKKGDVKFVPAIFLEYARRKNLNDNVYTGTFIALDAITLVGGATTILNIGAKLSHLRKAIILFEMANATGNLMLNSIDINTKYPFLKPAVEASNVLLIFTGVYEAGRLISKTKTFRGAFDQAKIFNSVEQDYVEKCKDFVTKVNAQESSILQTLQTATDEGSKKALRELLALRDKFVNDAMARGEMDWSKLGIKEVAQIGNPAVTFEDYLKYANDAYNIYSRQLPSAITQIEIIIGDLGVVSGRAKRPESAVNRLQRAVENGWVKEINSVDVAIKNIWDALGTRIVIKEGNVEYLDEIINKLCNAIKNGELDVISVNSLSGEGGIPYLSEKHLLQIQNAGLSIGKPISSTPKLYESGYTVGTIYIKYPNNVLGELQIIGNRTLEIANAEHLVYDAFLGKPYADYLNQFSGDAKDIASKLILNIRTPAISLNESQQVIYNSYLNQVYINARKVEMGVSSSTVKLPTGFSKYLSVENLTRTDEILQGLKSGKISIKEATEYLNSF